MNELKIPLSRERIASFCQRWRVTELAIFGSALRDDFNELSDIDVLVTFDDSAEITLLDFAQMQIELEQVFNRPVDVIEKAALRNPYRRKGILETSLVVYVD